VAIVPCPFYLDLLWSIIQWTKRLIFHAGVRHRSNLVCFHDTFFAVNYSLHSIILDTFDKNKNTKESMTNFQLGPN
jgi:hypothetical protein